MVADPQDNGTREAARLELADKSPDELVALVLDRFDDACPSEGLSAGILRDRVRQFVLNRVRAVCGQASEVGR